MVIDHDDADDLTQEIFIKIHRHIDGFREDAQLFTWIYRIATNESLTFLEKEASRFASLKDQNDLILGASLPRNKKPAESRDSPGLQMFSAIYQTNVFGTKTSA